MHKKHPDIDFSGLLWAVLLFVVFPNIFFFGAAFFAGVERYYINVDYCVPVLLAVLGFRWIGVCVFVFLVLVDLLFVVGQFFPFVRMGDILYLSKFFALSPSGYRPIIFLSLLAIIIKCFFLYRFSGLVGRKLAVAFCGALLSVCLVEVYAREVGDGRGIWEFSSDYIVSSQVKNFIDYRGSKFLENVSKEGDPFSEIPAEASAVSLWGALKGNQGPAERLLLIVVESWGVPREADIQKALLRPLYTLANGRLEQGVLPFDGVTVGGELRELCQLVPNHFNFSSAVSGLEGCLPNKLKAQGYRTLSMHGAVSLMYDRHDWYPLAGLEENIFYESRVWPRRCYSFPGACDLDMMGEISSYFSGDGKRFMYWLTLNSHSMYDARDIRSDAFDCEAFGVELDSRGCRHLKLQAQFFEGLGRLLSSKDMHDVHVLLVGDHRPLLIESKGYKAMFEYGQVPWVSLVVN